MIGIFDSGVGGLTVMRAITRAIPHVPIVYFGDTARLPYGDKSPEAIRQYSRENTQFLVQQNVGIIVIACHTASALALHVLKQEFKVPIVGVIDPAVCQAVAATRNGRIAVLATRGTIASGVYQKALLQQSASAHVVPIACPLFVPLVEERLENHEATRLIVRDYLALAKCERVDTVILGCTHYPLLAAMIQRELGEDVVLVDSAEACARQLGPLMSQTCGIEHPTAHRFFVSDDPDRFRVMGERILGTAISFVQSSN
jgi:glutamate racemase